VGAGASLIGLHAFSIVIFSGKTGTKFLRKIRLLPENPNGLVLSTCVFN
jgi:hypothetical protein